MRRERGLQTFPSLKSVNICLLADWEIHAYERDGTIPACETNHRHLPPSKAERLVVDQGADWISLGAIDLLVGRQSHGPIYDKRRLRLFRHKVWKSCRGTLQMVDGVIQGRNGHFSCSVPAHGAHGRLLIVHNVNQATT